MSNTLQLGDILIFKAGDDWIGKSIAWLTNSDVSHSAMVCGEDTIVEMGSSGISVSKILSSPGDHAHVLRLDPARDPQPLIQAADAYKTAGVRYDFPALVILAGLLIYRHIRPTPRFVKITDLILRLACKEVDKLLQKMLRHPGPAMVCSQLVYQIYRDCGKDYEIHIEGGDLQSSFNNIGDTVRLIDLLDGAEAHSPGNRNLEEPVMMTDSDELAHELYVAMVDAEQDTMDSFGSPDLGPLLGSADHFLEMLEKILEAAGSDIPIDALFITPSDLAYHAENLVEIQKVDVKRIK